MMLDVAEAPSALYVWTEAAAPLARWLLAFAVTQAVEMPLYWLALRVPWRVAFFASALTHPVVWFVFPWVWRGWLLGTYGSMVLAAELFAWLGEAAYFGAYVAWVKRRERPQVGPSVRFAAVGITAVRIVALALATNFASFAVGLTARSIWGVP